MNKAELITAAADRADISRKDAEKVVNAALEIITEELVAGERVSLVGFGSFDVKTRGERVGRNPRTREEIPIAATRVPQFKAGKALKEVVAK